MSPLPLLTIKGLGVTYRGASGPALSDVSLTLEEKRRLAIIGESGSGKSTLARCIAGLLPSGARTTGELIWNDAKVRTKHGSFPAPGRDIAYVFQDPGASLNPVLTIGEQVSEAAIRHLGLTRRQALNHARDLLAGVQLTHAEALLSPTRIRFPEVSGNELPSPLPFPLTPKS